MYRKGTDTHYPKDVDREGTKTPIKGYTWDEIESIDVDERIDVHSDAEARRAHTILHWAWDDESLPDWTYEQIIAEHARIVRFLTEKGERHVDRGSLDTTLPDDLKEYTDRPGKDLTYVRAINDRIRRKLEQAGIDSVRKLRKADPDEIVEKTKLDRTFVEYIQDRAESF